MTFPLRISVFALPTLCVLPVLLASVVPRPPGPGGVPVGGKAAASPGGAVMTIAEMNSAQWKVLKDRKGHCQISVPADWATLLPGMAIPPGGGTHASVSSIPGGSLGDVKGIAAMTYKPTSVTEDSPTRYAFQYGTSGLHSYAARAFPSLVCAVEVDVSTTERVAALADDVKTIVTSLDRVR